MLYAMLPPVPPRVKEGLKINGKVSFSTAFSPSSILLTYMLFGVSNPIFDMASLNNSLSSAFFIA